MSNSVIFRYKKLSTIYNTKLCIITMKVKPQILSFIFANNA